MLGNLDIFGTMDERNPDKNILVKRSLTSMGQSLETFHVTGNSNDTKRAYLKIFSMTVMYLCFILLTSRLVFTNKTIILHIYIKIPATLWSYET